MKRYEVTLVTVAKRADALCIARALVEAKLAACVNVVPGVTSVYSWKGKRCEEREILLVIKSRADRRAALARRVLELHPYDVPEVLHVPVGAGSAAYLRWIDGIVD